MPSIIHLAYGTDQPWPYIACGISAWSPVSSREVGAVTCARCKRSRYYRWRIGELKELFPAGAS